MEAAASLKNNVLTMSLHVYRQEAISAIDPISTNVDRCGHLLRKYFLLTLLDFYHGDYSEL